MKYTLRKEEKLRHKILVDGLFSRGSGMFDFPIRMVWRVLTPEEFESSFRCGVPEESGKLQMLITVPKKKRRRAVDRVLMRRRIREAYRLNRLPLKAAVDADPRIGVLVIAFIYQTDTNLPYYKIERKMQRLLDKLARKLTPTPKNYECGRAE